MEDHVISVSEFVALVNQTFEFAYPSVSIEGEVSEFRVSKNRWVYFNLQDEESSVKMFGTVYQLKHPIEDGMKVVVKGAPRLHNKYGFSVNISSFQPVGEGSIKRAFELMKKKLADEGLFDEARKRVLPRYPVRVGLITSSQAAAYADFMKIIEEQWVGLQILHADVQVQGENAIGQIVRAIHHFSEMPEPVDVLVLIRGGGSAEDLMVFSTEDVARAVAGSRAPTLVGVGHETDVSLADLVADVRATTPTNAAQILVPHKVEIERDINNQLHRIGAAMTTGLDARIKSLVQDLRFGFESRLNDFQYKINQHESLLHALSPQRVLERGYSLVTDTNGAVVRDAGKMRRGDIVKLQFLNGTAKAKIQDVEK